MSSIRHTNLETFKETKGLSYSRLSKLADGPQAYKRGLEDRIDSSALSLGSAVDLLLTAPDKFHDEIFVMSVDKPDSDMMCKFCEVYAETDDTEKAHIASGYKINLDRTMKKFEEEGKMYHDALVRSKGKQIIDYQGYSTAQYLAKQLTTNEFTKQYFIPQNDNIELMFQVPLLWDLTYPSIVTGEDITVPAKSLLDIIYIDHNKQIVRPVELKTGADSFMKSFWRYRRYIQGAMYYHSVLQTVLLDQYTIEPTKFIYADTNLIYPPVIHAMNFEDIQYGAEGRKSYFVVKSDDIFIEKGNLKYKFKGYKQLVAELEWHEKNDKWDYSYDVYQNNGEIDIDFGNVKL